MPEQTVRTLPRAHRFPADLGSFRLRFATEKACLAFLRSWRFPDGFRCPRCAADGGWWIAARRLYQCRACGRQTSLTAGTVFHGSRKPLRLWFLAMFLCVCSKRGISALELARQVGISRNTAWTWLHKLRVAMEDRDQLPLCGLVEVDEAYVGGLEEGRGGRSLEKKACVGAAVELKTAGQGFGRIRLAHLEDASSDSLEAFVSSQVRPGATVRTDGWPGYRHLEQRGYEHQVVLLRSSDRGAHKLFPGVHRVFSLLKRVLLGTYQGSVSRKHLQKYLSEFEFRFNRRSSKSRGLLFQRLLSAAVCDRSSSYKELISGKEKEWLAQRWAA